MTTAAPSANPFVIDGAAISEEIIARVAADAAALTARGVKPGLAVVLVGDDPASRVYVGAKGKAAQQCGFHSLQYDLPATTSEDELLALVRQL
ncbi:MAG: bifunctional methylenetetrahydrofolate dehydrogenase/methenyltetrahydrofolate cyclohydrolase, partial [Hyphomicrobiales bacterium]|nr:bifunctional methylenetetrahydrofolate dehydrogenase/methenyltetrahydrofolate cyclohydrolase [Hyphomicrobiales bacterium]